MTEVFADTFYWLALLNPTDAFHDLASAFEIKGHLVTSTAVQLEVLDGLATRSSLRHLAEPFWNSTTHADDVTVVPLESELFAAAVELLNARDDKLWSMTDCISFEIMRRRGITTALTADQHYVQAGFEVVFNPK